MLKCHWLRESLVTQKAYQYAPVTPDEKLSKSFMTNVRI